MQKVTKKAAAKDQGDTLRSTKEIERDIERLRDTINVRSFSYNLNKLIEKRSISQNRLAELAGVSRAMISSYRKGKGWPGLTKLWRLAIALDVDPAELIDPVDQAFKDFNNKINALWLEISKLKDKDERHHLNLVASRFFSYYTYNRKKQFQNSQSNLPGQLETVDSQGDLRGDVSSSSKPETNSESAQSASSNVTGTSNTKGTSAVTINEAMKPASDRAVEASDQGTVKVAEAGQVGHPESNNARRWHEESTTVDGSATVVSEQGQGMNQQPDQVIDQRAKRESGRQSTTHQDVRRADTKKAMGPAQQFSGDVIHNVEVAVDASLWYTANRFELHSDQKKTINRLLKAYLNVK